MDVRTERIRYIVCAPEPVGAPGVLLHNILHFAGPEGAVLIRFDFPIGLPNSYAAKTRINNFINILPVLEGSRWADFYNVAQFPEQISIKRPFYPNKTGPKGTIKQTDLIEKLEVSSVKPLPPTLR